MIQRESAVIQKPTEIERCASLPACSRLKAPFNQVFSPAEIEEWSPGLDESKEMTVTAPDKIQFFRKAQGICIQLFF